jgi:hypothetical protein
MQLQKQVRKGEYVLEATYLTVNKKKTFTIEFVDSEYFSKSDNRVDFDVNNLKVCNSAMNEWLYYICDIMYKYWPISYYNIALCVDVIFVGSSHFFFAPHGFAVAEVCWPGGVRGRRVCAHPQQGAAGAQKALGGVRSNW